MRAWGRIYLEALFMGVSIALTVWLLRLWLGDSGIGLRVFVFCVAGVGICFMQYWVGRWRR